jgi:small subunit ribosomal protein S1
MFADNPHASRRPLRVWRVTKYDPADRDERGYYIGSEDTDSDHDPVEAAYLATVAAFAEDSGIDTVQIREPSVPIVIGVRPAVGRFGGLAEIFGGDLDGYHDGAVLA